MTDTNFPLTADGDMDDLPRTLRRAKEAQAREARERQSSGLEAQPAYGASEASYAVAADAYPAVVTRYDVPFFHLMMFLLKAVLAAIPALILLTAVLWCMGQALQTFFPDLVKMKILISFPNG